METFRVRQDEAFARVVTLRGLDGRALADTYFGTEELSASLLAGDSRAEAATLVAAWHDHEAGEVLVSLDAEDVAALARGVYTARLLIYDGGEPFPAWEARVEVLAAPGTDVAPTSYATYDGMLGIAGDWLPKLQGEAAQSGYAEDRHKALQWTHRNVIARCEAYLSRHAGGYLGDPEAAGLLEAVGAASGTGAALMAGRLTIIADALDTGTALALTPTIVEANEYYAASLVVGRVMPSKDGADFRTMAMEWRGKANSLLSQSAFVVSIEGAGAFSLPPV